MAIVKGFTFDGINSLDYGIAITEEGAYSAPDRDVEIIEIPGRNGNYILDNGRFSNIEITYHCVIGNDNQDDFIDTVSNFRNALLSRVGYKRLTDDFHPDEFRLASFTNGIDFKNTPRIAGEFDVVFNCKPQRFLVSGETDVSITSGGAITNPTPFPSSPLLMVEGYGDITLGDEMVSIQDSPLGVIKVSENERTSNSSQNVIYTTNAFYGTDMIVDGSFEWYGAFSVTDETNPVVDISLSSVDSGLYAYIENYYSYGIKVIATYTIARNNSIPVESGTVIKSFTVRCLFEDETQKDIIFQCRVNFGSDRFSQIQVSTTDVDAQRIYGSGLNGLRANPLYVDSTYSALGNPLYLDLENGQAYKYDDGAYTSVNNAVWLGAELPTLKSGVTTITYDSDIHDLKIIPRWWKI